MALVKAVESKATLGLPLVVAPLSLRREGAYGTAGVRARCSDSSNKCSARALSDVGMGKSKPALMLASESLQYKEDREEGQAKGLWHSKQVE